MITQIRDRVLNYHSQQLAAAIMNKENELEGEVYIDQNENSGWIYVADENGNCYLFSDNENKILEQHISCPNCGYENFVTDFRNESTDDCCKSYFKIFRE